MRKRFFCITVAFVLIIQSITAFAIDSKLLYSDVRYFKANIYVCDTQNSEAILLNVVPVNGIQNISLTQGIEYKAMPINDNAIYALKGNKLTMEYVNEHLLDSPVRVLIAKNAYGYKIISMDLLR